jgi:hypothetical protein
MSRRRDQTRRPPPLPRESEDVMLASEAGERMAARVERADDDALLLVLLLPPPVVDEGDEDLGELVLEFSCRRGFVRLGGHAEIESGDLVRFRDVQALEVIQRRRFVRISAVRPVAVALPDDAGEIHTSSVDVSGDGMLLAGPDTLQVGDEVRFRFRTEPDADPIEGVGRVVRVVENGHRAIEFESITPRDRQRLIRFVFERERRARQITRDGTQ